MFFCNLSNLYLVYHQDFEIFPENIARSDHASVRCNFGVCRTGTVLCESSKKSLVRTFVIYISKATYNAGLFTVVLSSHS